MKKALMPVMVLLVVFIVTPVMAKPIGPQKAEKNPNIMITPGEGAELILPSGVNHMWAADTEIDVLDFMNILDASKAKIRSAASLSLEDLIELMMDPEAALEAENKWGYISHDVLVDLLIFEGYPEEVAEAIASRWPEGVYWMFVNVGK